MTTPTERISVECPHPHCRAVLKVPHDLPAGVYPCICKSCNVRIRWATYITGERVPSAELAQEEPKK